MNDRTPHFVRPLFHKGSLTSLCKISAEDLNTIHTLK